MHSQDGEEADNAQMARARTRHTVHHRPRRANPLPDLATERDRNPLDEARRRWTWGGPQPAPQPDGDPAEELDDDAREDDGDSVQEAAEAARPRLRAPLIAPQAHLSPFSSWSGASLPVRATWATFVYDGRRAKDASPFLLAGYLVIAIPAFPVHCLFRLAQDSTTSVTRFIVFAITVTILIVGIAVAF